MGKARITIQTLMFASSSALRWSSDSSSPSLLVRFWNSLSELQAAAVIATAVLTIGAVIEYWEKFKLIWPLFMKWTLFKSNPFERCVLRRVAIHSLGPILVVIGIGGEVIFEGRTFVVEDRQEEQSRAIVGSLRDKATVVSNEEKGLEKRIDAAALQMGALETRTNGAESSAEAAAGSAMRASELEKQLRVDVEDTELFLVAKLDNHTFLPFTFKSFMDINEPPLKIHIECVAHPRPATREFAAKLAAVLSRNSSVTRGPELTSVYSGGVIIRNKWVSSSAQSGPGMPAGQSIEVDTSWMTRELEGNSKDIGHGNALRLALLALALKAKLEKTPDLPDNSLFIIVGSGDSE
jgi:hypothetical protein